MKIYLVEVELVKGQPLEPIAAKINFEMAYGLVGGRVAIVTEMNLDEEYPNGIGVCRHWHFGEEEVGEG
ncbi:MAG: hypothetical protein IMZ47_03155 [Firmicutes bacterium]|nr:hypothetical protein [Bacillota bacterium]